MHLIFILKLDLKSKSRKKKKTHHAFTILRRVNFYPDLWTWGIYRRQWWMRSHVDQTLG